MDSLVSRQDSRCRYAPASRNSHGFPRALIHVRLRSENPGEETRYGRPISEGNLQQMELITVKIEKPAEINFVLGQTHFIKTVEDIHETLVAAVPGIRFGLAFCEASGKCLVRWSGTDPAMIKLAQENAQMVGAGHSFLIFFGEGFYPMNVLNALKNVAEVSGIDCATANAV